MKTISAGTTPECVTQLTEQPPEPRRHRAGFVSKRLASARDGHAEAEARGIRGEAAAFWLERAVEDERLDPRVIVEVFDVPERADRAPDVGVDVWRAVRRERHPERLREPGNGEDAAHTAAARRVGLEDVEAVRGEGCGGNRRARSRTRRRSRPSRPVRDLERGGAPRDPPT